MTNRYLLKIAELSNENKQVAHTFLSSWGASIPADIAGAYVGSRLGKGYKGFKMPMMGTHITGGEAGGTLGAVIASGAVELAAIKHSLHGKVNNNE